MKKKNNLLVSNYYTVFKFVLRVKDTKTTFIHPLRGGLYRTSLLSTLIKAGTNVVSNKYYNKISKEKKNNLLEPHSLGKFK